jgi:outer membrane protein TolC
MNEMWDDLGSWSFPSWSVGIEFSIPLGGGIESKYELSAARAEARKLLLEFRRTETRLINAIQTAIQKVNTNFTTVADYRTVLEFNEDRLQTNLEMLKVGTVHGQRVLEVEEEVFAARQSVADALVQYRQVQLALHLLEGSTLGRHEIELTHKELRERTETITRNLQVPLKALPVSSVPT